MATRWCFRLFFIMSIRNFRLSKKGFYDGLWLFFDNFFDLILVLAIITTAFAGFFELLDPIFHRKFLPPDMSMTQFLKVALNSILVVKIYETLRMFISHEDLSLTHLIEVGLIWLAVKIFFDSEYMKINYWILFLIFFVCYIILKWWRNYLVFKKYDIKLPKENIQIEEK